MRGGGEGGGATHHEAREQQGPTSGAHEGGDGDEHGEERRPDADVGRVSHVDAPTTPRSDLGHAAAAAAAVREDGRARLLLHASRGAFLVQLGASAEAGALKQTFVQLLLLLLLLRAHVVGGVQ